MRRILLGGVALLALVAAAQAADLPPAQYPAKAPAPPVAVGYDWTGFYLGGYYGNSVTQSTMSTPGPLVGNTNEGAIGINNGGWSGGVTGGYNWQFAPAWLVGVEADFGYLGGSKLFLDFDEKAAAGEKNSWYGTARGRFGYVTGPSLIYVTGGVGFVHVTDTFGGNNAAPFVTPTSSSTTTVGGTVGAGIETKLSRNWTTKTEYLYIDGGRNHSFGSNVFGGAPTTTTFNHSFQVIKTGLNYRFDGNWDGLPFFNAPLLASNHNWNGFYIGGNAGIGSSLTQVYAYGQGGAFTGGNENINGIGFVGGGQLGYNYMLWQKYLIGVEGDFNAFAMSHSVTDWFDPTATFTQKTRWYGTARLRAGTTTGPALLYMTGGLAWVNFQDGVVPNPAGVAVAGGISTKTGQGWTFGGGTEVALDAHWSAKLESLYVNSGSTIHNTFAPAGTLPAQFRERFVIVRAGLNYALN